MYSPSHTHLSCISSALGGIVLAGTLYPIVLYTLVIASTIMRPYGPGPGPFFEEIFLVVLIGTTIGAVLSAITGLASVVLVYLMNRSLGYPLDEASAVISAGSMAGYMPTVFAVFSAMRFGGMESVAFAGALGPLLAMTMGAIGASWSARKWGGFDISRATVRKRKLSVFHLMMATTWVAVTFAIANAWGGPEFAIAVAGWFALQGLMLAIFGQFRRKS